MKKDEYTALQQGKHGDPFSILGPHKKNRSKKYIYRFFDPYAESIDLCDHKGKKISEAKRLEGTDLFEAEYDVLLQAKDYLWKISDKEGGQRHLHDPYAFGPQLSDFDLQLWGEGTSYRAYSFMGSHFKDIDGVSGTHFIVAAPSANRVSVVGNFNNWDGRRHAMRKYHEQGLWEIFIPGIESGESYKYEISHPDITVPMLKSDPYGRFYEKRPATASIVHKMAFDWSDENWIQSRKEARHLSDPISIYEVHLGSWKKNGAGSDDFLTYRELAEELIPYVQELGFTHIELLPVAEHPYDPSWGYQVTGYFAPTSRFGKPEDFKYFVDACHKAGIGVIVDWVPAHFTKDDHGLRFFDGTHLYEHADPRQGEHKDWGTNIFNFGRTEVLNFLLSNAVFWLEEYHIDGLRVDAVASMLYLDYSREEGEWIPNKFGGRENLEAIEFLKRFNEIVHKEFPGVLTMAEESTAWPMVSKPTYVGGLGFDFKWNMGWMNDTLSYFEHDPIHRRYHHGQLTFSLIYAFSENFLLPLSHDEVVHGKKSLVGKMPGDDWQKMANLRLLYAYMYTHPGKKLLFMGSEFAQWIEWNAESQLDWALLDFETHLGIKRLIKDLNGVYKAHLPMHEVDSEWTGFEWIDFSDVDHSIVSFLRWDNDKKEHVVCVYNFTPVVHPGYYIGVPEVGEYKVLINTDRDIYGGSNVHEEFLNSEPVAWHNQPARIKLTLPPLAGVIMELNKLA